MSLLGTDSPAQVQRDLDRKRSTDSLHQGAQQQMWRDDGHLSPEYIETMTNTELQAGTVDRLTNLVTKDWVLGFLNEAETHEAKWLVVELTLQEINAMHPPRDSNFTGGRRAWLLDDEDEDLEPLSPRERQAIATFLRGLYFRITRSRDGNQQEQFTKSVTVSEVRDENDGKNGLFSGWFS